MAWAEFYKLEPFLADRLEVQMGLLISKVHNLFAKEPLAYTEFMLTHKKQDKRAEFIERLRNVNKQK